MVKWGIIIVLTRSIVLPFSLFESVLLKEVQMDDHFHIDGIALQCLYQLEIHDLEFVSLYCSGLGLAIKKIVQGLEGSCHQVATFFYALLVGAGLQSLCNSHVLLLICQLILLLTYNSLTSNQISSSSSLCLGPMCMQHGDKYPLLLKVTHYCETEGGERQTSFQCVFVGSNHPHGFQYVLKCQFSHAFVHIQFPFPNKTLVDLK